MTTYLVPVACFSPACNVGTLRLPQQLTLPIYNQTTGNSYALQQNTGGPWFVPNFGVSVLSGNQVYPSIGLSSLSRLCTDSFCIRRPQASAWPSIQQPLTPTSTTKATGHFVRKEKAASGKADKVPCRTRHSKAKLEQHREATAEDVARWNIPAGYCRRNWDPTERPLLLLGSVFDVNSLGK